ncbi:MAG: alpha/beta hydrolase family protein [Pyrinomonadaceae bacterium]
MKTVHAILVALVVAAALPAYSRAGVQGQRQKGVPHRRMPVTPHGGEGSPKAPHQCPGVRECTDAENDLPTQLHVEFPGPGGMTLHGHLYVPGVTTREELRNVARRYPAMIYNHGSEQDPKGVPHLAKLYVDHGYVFFAPDRHGQGLSADAGPYHVDEQQKHKGQPDFGAWDVKLHELYNKDVIAAVEWFKQQPYVDAKRLAMTGILFGGIQTLLTAEKDPGIKAYVAFAPSAESWGVAELRERLKTAVRDETAPMFIIQAQGDYNLGPVETLGGILDHKGRPLRYRSKLYPRFGCTNQDAHARFAMSCDGIAVWHEDVLDFLDRWVK